MRIVQLTDIHLTANDGTLLYGIDTARSLRRAVDQVKELANQPDAAIVTGDLAEDGSETTYRRLRRILETLEVPVYVLPGNHDNISTMRSILDTDGFHCVDSARLGDWGLIFVNSQVPEHSHGHVSSADFTTLESNISNLGDVPILVGLHHTPSTVCPSFGCQLENFESFTDLLNTYANVKGVIAGHTHTASEIDAGRHTQFTTPSTFAHVTHAQTGESVDHGNFWDAHEIDGALQGFRILDLCSDGSIQSEVHWIQRTENKLQH